MIIPLSGNELIKQAAAHLTLLVGDPWTYALVHRIILEASYGEPEDVLRVGPSGEGASAWYMNGVWAMGGEVLDAPGAAYVLDTAAQEHGLSPYREAFERGVKLLAETEKAADVMSRKILDLESRLKPDPSATFLSQSVASQNSFFNQACQALKEERDYQANINGER